MLRTVTDAENHDTTFTYWPSDLKKTMTYNNLDAQQWTYDEALNLTIRVNPNAHYQVFKYDNRNRKTAMGWHRTPDADALDIVWANGVYDCTYAYDAAGRLTDAVNATSSVKRGYDAAGRLQFDRQTFPAIGSKEVQYDYNADGKVNRMVIPPTSYDFNFRYDQRGRLAKYIMGSGTAPTYEYVYDAASNVVERKNYFNGMSQVFGRDSLNRATRRDVVGAGGYIARESYGYDRLSRMSTVKRELSGRLDRYDYDYVGQLKSAEYDLSWNGSAWVNPASTGNYTWDLVGNRESVTDANGTKAYTSNDVNEYTVVGGKTVYSAPSHQMMSYDGVTYNYISDTYLAEVIKGSNNYQLRYDALGRCVQRTMNGASTYYLFDGEHWIMEFNSAGAELSNVLYGLGIDEIIARGNRGQGQFAIQDWLGSTSIVLGFGGEVLEKYSYDAFGTPTIKGPTGAVRAVSAINNTFMFTSREYQSTFGIYEYRNRAYHPGLGRFTTEDPKGFDAGDYNLFRYCAGDPVNRTDPMGLEEYYPDAHVTAYAFGPDNAYAGHANGGDHVALATDRSRREIVRNAKGKTIDVIQHAALGKGSFENPSSMATHPDSKIPMGSRAFVGGKLRAWFVVEDTHAAKYNGKTLDQRFDMYAGKADQQTLKNLDGRRDVTVYKPGEKVPLPMQQTKPGPDWKLSPEGDRVTDPATSSSAPSAAQVDAAHQATGVPSLGAEAINIVRGPP